MNKGFLQKKNHRKMKGLSQENEGFVTSLCKFEFSNIEKS